jgi:amidophosphoribosyltransferase
MGEQLKIACGVFGAINFEKQPIFPYIYWGMRAQNHRGHQSHGFLTYDDGKFHIHRSLDLIPKIKTSAIQEWFGRLPGHVGIGNVIYTTSGKYDEKSLIKGTQPVTASKNGFKLAVSFNGNAPSSFWVRLDALNLMFFIREQGEFETSRTWISHPQSFFSLAKITFSN